MTDTPQRPPIQIRRWTDDSVIYESTTAANLKEAVEQAVAADVVLDYARLDYARLDYARLDNVRLDNARLDYASLVNASLVNASLVNASLVNASLVNVRLDNARLDYASLVNASLVNASLVNASLVNASLVNARLVNASLDYARLDNVRLDNARLVNARLDCARLVNASLDGKKVVAIAQVSFTAHGECGRQLMGIRTEDGATHLRCGCWSGSPDELRAYIANQQPHLARTRTLALETALGLLDAKNDPMQKDEE